MWFRSRRKLAWLLTLIAGLLTVVFIRSWLTRHKTNNDYGTDQQRELFPSYSDIDGLALSPDGSEVVVERRSSDIHSHRFQTYLVLGMKLIHEVDLPLPNRPAAPLLGTEFPTVQLCDDGKLVLAYLGNAHFIILDAASLRTISNLSIPLDAGSSSDGTYLLAACSARAPVGLFSRLSPKTGTLVTEQIDLRNNARLSGQVDTIGGTNMANTAISPSGSAFAVAFWVGARPKVLLKPSRSGSHLLPISSNTDDPRVAFAGDQLLAIASSGRGFDENDTTIQLFDTALGSLRTTLRVPNRVARAPVLASADGDRLVAYTAQESLKEGELQIQSAGWTAWDLKHATITASSSSLNAVRVGAEPFSLPNLPGVQTRSYRPTLVMSDSGDAVIAIPGFGRPIIWFALPPSSMR